MKIIVSKEEVKEFGELRKEYLEEISKEFGNIGSIEDYRGISYTDSSQGMVIEIDDDMILDYIRLYKGLIRPTINVVKAIASWGEGLAAKVLKLDTKWKKA